MTGSVRWGGCGLMCFHSLVFEFHVPTVPYPGLG